MINCTAEMLDVGCCTVCYLFILIFKRKNSTKLIFLLGDAFYKGQSNKNRTPAIKHSSQKLAILLLRFNTAICRVGDMHSENTQVHTVVSLLLWR